MEEPVCGALEEGHEVDAYILELYFEPLVRPSLAKHMLTVRITEIDSKVCTPSIFCSVHKPKASTRENFVQHVMYWHLPSLYALKIIVCESSILTQTLCLPYSPSKSAR